MDSQFEQIRKVLESYKLYQWIKGEHFGKVTGFRDIIPEGDKIWIMFNDGTRVNFSMFDEFIWKANLESELLELTAPSQPAHIGPPNKAGANQMSASVVTSKPLSPVQALLKKQKENPVGINITMELNVPSIELYSVICGSFENAEDEIVDFVVSSLDINDIKEIIKGAIKNYYKA